MSVAENIAYGTEGKAAIIALIIDDGTPSKGHRKNIYSTASTLMGAYTAPNVTYGTETV